MQAKQREKMAENSRSHTGDFGEKPSLIFNFSTFHLWVVQSTSLDWDMSKLKSFGDKKK